MPALSYAPKQKVNSLVKEFRFLLRFFIRLLQSHRYFIHMQGKFLKVIYFN